MGGLIALTVFVYGIIIYALWSTFKDDHKKPPR